MAIFDKIYDLIALRIIVDDLSTGYLVLGILHDMYQPMYERIKDYVANPKPNGYQSLHTTVQTPSGQIVEFQIEPKKCTNMLSVVWPPASIIMSKN